MFADAVAHNDIIGKWKAHNFPLLKLTHDTMTAEEQLKILNEKLEEFVKAYKSFKELGLDEEIIIAYIFYKTRLPRKDILKILESQDEFYKKLTNNLVLDALEGEEEKSIPTNIGPYLKPATYTPFNRQTYNGSSITSTSSIHKNLQGGSE